MRYTLENEKLIVEIDSFGAELKSVRSKADNREYMWYADKKYWARTSPVLFPFVGSLKNKEYSAKGKTYSMGQHGFARDMEHTMISQSDDTIWFKLESSDDTISKYPYEFVLKIGYQLKDNGLKVLWEVENPGAEALPFSIGAHPAFICPVDEGDRKEGYRISFGRFDREAGNVDALAKDATTTEKTNGKAGVYTSTVIDFGAKTVAASEIHHHGNTRDTGLAISEDIVLPLTAGSCDITEGFFDRCTYMIEGNQANSVGLIDPEGHEYITVLFDTPLFAIWSPEEKNAPFVCIEPWYGRCDHVDFAGEITDREYTNVLSAGDRFHAEYVMKYN